jgi:serine protease
MSRSYFDNFSTGRRRRLRASGAIVLGSLIAAGVSVSVASAGGVQDDPVWGLDRIDQQELPLNEEYSHKYSGKGVTVYVFGSGIHANNMDIFGRAKGDGVLPVDEEWETRDCNGDGTHAAATIGGSKWGVAPDATLVSLKIRWCNFELGSSTFAPQFDWAINDHGEGEPAVALVDLASYDHEDDDVLDALAQSLLDDGITVVAPAGDDPATSSCEHAPAGLPGVITVGASTSSDERWSSGSAGSCVDLYAPGVDITSAGISTIGASTERSGTLPAAAHVTGVVAQLLEEVPSRTPTQVWNTMHSRVARDVVTGVPAGETDDLVQVMRATPPGATELHGFVRGAERRGALRRGGARVGGAQR